MPELVTFQGRPVKRRIRAPNGLRLILYHPRSGAVGEQITVSQHDWQQYGRVEFFTKAQMPDVRALSAQS